MKEIDSLIHAIEDVHTAAKTLGVGADIHIHIAGDLPAGMRAHLVARHEFDTEHDHIGRVTRCASFRIKGCDVVVIQVIGDREPTTAEAARMAQRTRLDLEKRAEAVAELAPAIEGGGF